MSKATKEAEILSRTADLPVDAIVDEARRLVRLSFSSEEAVTRQSFFADPWVEVLGHQSKEPDLSRLNNAAPLLYNHDRRNRDNRIGVVERAWLENGRGYAEVRFSKRDDVAGIWQDVLDGILRNVSVSYKITKRVLQEERQNDLPVYRVTAWQPMEISMVDIPADPTVGVGRHQEPNEEMNEDSTSESALSPPHRVGQQTEAGGKNQREELNMPEQTETTEQRSEVDTTKLQADARAEGAKQALELEQSRRKEIRELFARHADYEDLRDECLDDSEVDIHLARQKLLDEMGRKEEPATAQARVEVGESEIDKFSRYAEHAVALRAGVAEDSAKDRSELCGYSLLELARKSLELRNIRTERMDKRELVGRAFTHSTSDFPKILENNARKSMLRGYEEAEESFGQFTRTGNLSDFKPHTRVGMGVFESLDKIPEGSEYKHGTLGERYETIQLATYGKMFSITRQAIINDDLNAFTDIPRKMGRAAARTVGDLVWGVITSNPALSDGTALFHADHKNLGAAAAITAASIGKGRTAMRKQKDGAATLNIRPRFMLIPAALEDTARVLMASETDPAQQNSRVPNPVRGSLEIVVDARLDEASVTAWYLAADPSRFDTIEVGYLDGVSTPFLDRQEGWSVDGVEYKVRMDAAAAPLEFRTMYKNPGS